MSTDLEKYLQGRPINDDMAALMAGRDPALELEQEQAQASPAAGPDRRPITDDDREELRRWKLEPGWQIFRRLVDQWIDRQEAHVRQTSLADPLENREAVANGWAYIAMQRRALAAMEALIQRELEQLKATPKDKRTSQN
jgi:hypothetical protein